MEKTHISRPDIQFFHSFMLDDETIKGLGRYDLLKARADRLFEGRIKGRSVLDIGAWDGFFSFEAERQGAKRVLATDHYCWSGPGWGTKAGFDYIHARTESHVESLDIDLKDLSPERVGTFDVVLFLGVLYHLKDPLGGLERAASLCTETLMIETAGAMFECTDPVMRFYLGDELGGDATNFWAPNPLCLERMLKEVGFGEVEFLESREGPTRILARAYR